MCIAKTTNYKLSLNNAVSGTQAGSKSETVRTYISANLLVATARLCTAS